MSIKLVIDNNDFPIGFYDTVIHAVENIPVGAIDISDNQHAEFLANPGMRKWNSGTSQVDEFSDATVLANYKQVNKIKIDQLAETQRSLYITVGPGQALVYQEKSEEASDYIAAGSPVDLSPYPFIQAEVNATGDDATTASNNILAAQSTWITKGSAIEEIRIKGKIDIDAGTTLSVIDGIILFVTTNIQAV